MATERVEREMWQGSMLVLLAPEVPREDRALNMHLIPTRLNRQLEIGFYNTPKMRAEGNKSDYGD